MRPELPDIARPAARRASSSAGNAVVRGIARLLRGQPFDQAVDLRDREAGDARCRSRGRSSSSALQLLGQQLLVPAGIERQLVVGEHVGALLRRASCFEANAGHFCHAEQLRRLDPAVAGEDRVLAVDQDRVGEAELLDAVGDLPDLLPGMGSRVALVRFQLSTLRIRSEARTWRLFMRFLLFQFCSSSRPVYRLCSYFNLICSTEGRPTAPLVKQRAISVS